MYMKIVDILIIVTGSILPIIISIIGLILSVLAYTNTKRRNSIDQLPYFDIDNSRTTVTYDTSINKYSITIALVNVGNGIATGILSKEDSSSKSKILYDTATKGYYTYYIIEKNISLNSSILNFNLFFSDLENNTYSQNFLLEIVINNKPVLENENFNVKTYKKNFSQDFYHFFLKERKTKKPIKV